MTSQAHRQIVPSEMLPRSTRTHSVDAARRQARLVTHRYLAVIAEYPETVVFNGTDMRLVLGVVDDLMRYVGGRARGS